MTDLRINIISDEEVECPEYPSPWDVGDRVVVGRGDLRGDNWCGGTMESDQAEPVLIIRKWWDYECGWRYRATLLAPPEITATNPHYLGDGRGRGWWFSEFGVGHTLSRKQRGNK